MFNKLYENIKEFIKYNYAFLIFLAFLFLFFNIETDYSIYKPGGSINISKRISSNVDYSKSKGSFNMAYVGMIKGKLPFYLIGKILPSWELVSNEEIIYSDTETIEDSLKRDRLYYDESISNAFFVAYEKSNTPYEIKSEKNHVVFVSEKFTGDVKIGDEILFYDDKEYTNIADLRTYINSKEINDIIKLTVKRGNKKIVTESKVFKEQDVLLIGISSILIYELDSATLIKTTSKASESGPSGGLLLSLAVYDALVADDITKGYKIVGTGTIDLDGNVGEIGGVKYKLSGAVKEKADIFLVPEANYKEAVDYAKKKNYDIIIKGVSTFDETLNFLNNMEVKK